MSLSEAHRRALEEIERALEEDDPKFAATVTPEHFQRLRRRWVIVPAMLFLFGAVMLYSNRFWPIWTTAAQLLTVLAHFGPVLRHADIAVPFAVSEQIWAWFILAQLIVVTAHPRPLLLRRR